MRSPAWCARAPRRWGTYSAYIVDRSRQAGRPPARHARLGKDLMSIMQKTSLDALAREQLEAARDASSGRAARTVYGGHEHVLRQTVIGLRAGHALAEPRTPGKPPCTCAGESGSSAAISPGMAAPEIC